MRIEVFCYRSLFDKFGRRDLHCLGVFFSGFVRGSGGFMHVPSNYSHLMNKGLPARPPA